MLKNDQPSKNRVSLAKEVYLELEKYEKKRTNITVGGDCTSMLFGSSIEQLRTETGQLVVSRKLEHPSIGLKRPLTSTPCTGRVLSLRLDRLYMGSAKVATSRRIKIPK
jgi:hypothetical protein